MRSRKLNAILGVLLTGCFLLSLTSCGSSGTDEVFEQPIVEPFSVTECVDSDFPACDGECPEGTTCADEAGVCACVPKPECVDSDFPACDGECPEGTTCADEAGVCACVSKPECDDPSDCPDDEETDDETTDDEGLG